MSKQKQSQSGLRTFKRDFSSSSSFGASSQPIDVDNDIDWSPTPPVPSIAKPLTGSEKRLKDIQDALAGYTHPPPSQSQVQRSAPLANSSSLVVNKRPHPSSSSDFDAPPAKRRLPSSWQDADMGAGPPSKQAIASRVQAAPKSTAATTTASSSLATAKPAKVFLSQEQNQILKLVSEGHSVFYTGSAGTGKSVLLREIIKTLRKKHVKTPDAVAVTASTGIAACNIGGVTIHSFSGIGLGIETAEELANKIKKNKKASARWLRTKVLIIDEVSMVDGDLFDKLARIGSMLRKKVDPFGGIQVIVTGDFFQLPPVTKGNAPTKFAFEAQLWNETIKRTFNLTKVFRQRDAEFVDMLNEMRFGRLSKKSTDKFKSLSREIVYDDGLGPTELFPRREDVDRANTTRVSRLRTETHQYYATDGGKIEDPNQRNKMLANFMAPGVLGLRIDAQVMLIKNMDETLVNGSMGKVVRFVDPALYGMEEVPDGAGGGAGGSGGKKSAVGGGIQYPVVAFSVPGGAKREVLVTNETWKVELPSGEVQVSRSQLPLILAWAMSIHKSQGQTLERVKVDLGKVFEKGQAYVALSRATSLDGLQVLNFSADKVNAHPKVAAWSRTLETIDLD